ncbi:MAG: hypothetical protein HFJ54_02680 [Clostridia bacterium]|nr:hypothetical protein [Clostridia bacterium]
MARLNERKLDEILDHVGVSLSGEDIKIILRGNIEAMELLQKMNRRNRIESKDELDLYERNVQAVRAVLKLFENEIDKSALVILSVYNCQAQIERNRGRIDKFELEVLEQYVKRGIKLLGKEEFEVIIQEYDSETNFANGIKVINSLELVKCIKSGRRLESLFKPGKAKSEKLAKVEKAIGLENVVQNLNLIDILDIVCKNPEVGKSITSQIAWNATNEYSEAHPEIDKEALFGDKELPEEINQDIKNYPAYKRNMANQIRSCCQYIDIDKLLLLAAFRFIDILENDENREIRVKTKNGNDNKEKDNSESLGIIKLILEKLFDLIQEGTVVNNIASINGIIEEYSKESLKKDKERFVIEEEKDPNTGEVERKVRYIRTIEIEETKKRLLSGEETFNSVDINVAGFIWLDENDFARIIEASEDNLAFLIANNIIPNSDVEVSLYIRGNCSIELFSLILEKKLLTSDGILSLFERRIIGIEHIEQIKDRDLLSGIDVFDSINKLCIEMQNGDEDNLSKGIEEFSRMAYLYKVLKIDGKSEEEVQRNSLELINSFEDNLSSEILERLYQFGIITLEVAADWGVDLKNMLSKGDIKPTDLKRLYGKEIIQIHEIRDVIRNGNLHYEEKLDLIYSTFDGESEEEYRIREELIQLLEGGESYRGESKQTESKRRRRSGVKSKEFITDPHARWKLISLLDKDYSKKFLPKGKEIVDGHRVFLMPNLSSVVIERMHEKRRGKKVNAYGSATYIMEIEEFFKNIDNVIVNGAINRTALRELAENEDATKIVHSKGWGESIKRYFEIDEENERYSKEEIEEINKAIASVGNSRRER